MPAYKYIACSSPLLTFSVSHPPSFMRAGSLSLSCPLSVQLPLSRAGCLYLSRTCRIGKSSRMIQATRPTTGFYLRAYAHMVHTCAHICTCVCTHVWMRNLIHIYPPPRSLSLSLSLSPSGSCALSCWLACSLSHARSLALFFSLSLTHTLSLSLQLRSHSFTCLHSATLT